VSAEPRFPNIEVVLMHWAVAKFEDEFPGGYEGGHVGLDFPDPVADYFFKPRRWPTGGRTKLNDYPLVDIEVLGLTYDGTEDLIESIDAELLGYPLSIATPTGVVVLDHVEQTRSPVRIEYFGDSSVVRFGATYQLSLRR
jgi:hypothetical protein